MRSTLHTKPGIVKPAARSVLLTMQQAADRLNTTVRFVRRLVVQRRIPYHKVGKYVRIAEADLEEFIAAGRVEPE